MLGDSVCLGYTGQSAGNVAVAPAMNPQRLHARHLVKDEDIVQSL